MRITSAVTVIRFDLGHPGLALSRGTLVDLHSLLHPPESLQADSEVDQSPCRTWINSNGVLKLCNGFDMSSHCRQNCTGVEIRVRGGWVDAGRRLEVLKGFWQHAVHFVHVSYAWGAQRRLHHKIAQTSGGPCFWPVFRAENGGRDREAEMLYVLEDCVWSTVVGTRKSGMLFRIGGWCVVSSTVVSTRESWVVLQGG